MTPTESVTSHDSDARESDGSRAPFGDVGSSGLDRRRFLTWLTRGSLTAAALAAIGQSFRFMAYEPPSTASDVYPLGQPSSFPLASMTYVAEARVYVGRDKGGLYAIDAVCTHLGCLVQQGEEGGFVCPCHNSAFDDHGNALNGPATKPLRFLSLWLDQDSALSVDRSKEVEPSTRLGI
jgi:cytochrome b6-f complex iron-sulfur subunit